MNELKVFENNELGKVRIIEKDGEPWFIAKDVCEVLGLNTSEAVRGRKDRNFTDGLDPDEYRDDIDIVDSIGRTVKTLSINESGLYNLIFKSRKEEAKQFKKWVTSEVLPSIRKTGGFVSNDDMFIDTYLPMADETTKMMFRTTLETVRKQNEQLKSLAPKADYFDNLVQRNLLTNIRDTAKQLGIKEKTFIEWLIEKRFIYRHEIDGKKQPVRPYSQYNKDLFDIKDYVRNGHAGNQTLITPKGKETFRLLLEKEGMI
jgi:prophage antirepressor-like protein